MDPSIADLVARFDEDVEDCEDDYYVTVKPRKTIKNIMTPAQAIRCNKASKLHKLKPRSVKRDKTKTVTSKAFSKKRSASHAP